MILDDVVSISRSTSEKQSRLMVRKCKRRNAETQEVVPDRIDSETMLLLRRDLDNVLAIEFLDVDYPIVMVRQRRRMKED